MTNYIAQWGTREVSRVALRWSRCARRDPTGDTSLEEALRAIIDEIAGDAEEGTPPRLILAVALIRAETLLPGEVITVPDAPLDPEPFVYRIVEAIDLTPNEDTDD